MDRTTDFSFFHGTSAVAADGILKYGAKNIVQELQIVEAASALWEAILKHVPNRGQTASFFERAGCAYAVSAPIGLENAASGNQSSLIAYGSFYASMSFRTACDYAFRGSEVLLVISQGMQALEHAQDPFVQEFKNKYPRLMTALKLSSHPVVIELKGIKEKRLLREDGNPISWPYIELVLEHMDRPDIRVPGAFRIEGVCTADIVAVYDLEDWPASNLDDKFWQPDATLRAQARVSPKEWVSS